MSTKTMLTTVDNPFDPFTQFDEWLAFDEGKGYYSCQLLARVTKSANSLSQAEEELAIEEAINEIVKFNLIGLYRKITKET